MSTIPEFVRLESKHCSLIFDCRQQTPVVHYYGPILTHTTTDEMLAILKTRQEAKCAAQIEAPLSLSPSLGHGFTGHPGIQLNDGGIAWSVGAILKSVERTNTHSVTFTSIDETRYVQIEHELSFDVSSDVLSCTTKITNLGISNLHIDECAAPTFALPDHITKILAFEGRWSQEFQTRSIDLFLGAYKRENRKGKTSHDNFPGIILHSKHTNESNGECYGFHLGWSGNHFTNVELLPEQRTYLQMGELLGVNEIQLKQNESYTTPTLYVSYSATGLTTLSQQFHRYVRGHLLRDNFHKKPRPIHYNTWEGVYFDHNLSTMKSLANLAAKAGAERFVLDDGWFKGRRHDHAGLGDWTVDPEVYPEGLQSIIDYVIKQGMAFGIWFEPEMVNPDSDLYRNHPDWVLSTKGNKQLKFRHQLVLDLTRQEVGDYLFAQMNDVLSSYPDISYIKWDMNRDINHSGDQFGTSAVHQQTLMVYSLIDRIKEAHPHIEIESCSSGGARIDFGILEHTDRVWTSDSNDALDRLSIQRGFSFFLPSNLMGSHVGPRDCHITGRHIPIETRVAVALFGHMGMEMDPRELTEHEMQTLQAGFKLHKSKRDLIHHGEYYRIDSDEYNINFGVVNEDKTDALFAYNSITETKRTQPKMYRFVGLDKQKSYTLDLVWPLQVKEYSPSILSMINGKSFSGEVLMTMGMQLPIVFVQTSLIFSLVES